MIYISNTEDFKIQESTIVAIGKFDGRHRGHEKLLNVMRDLEKKSGSKTAVFTFAIPPAAVVDGQEQKLLTTNEERRINLEMLGIDYLVEYPFTQSIAHMDPETFVRDIIVGKMNAGYVVAGTDCNFGYKRAGNANVLKKLGTIYGYKAVIIEKEQDDNRDISSSYIREKLIEGDMEKVTGLLGRPYSIHGVVVHGSHIGAGLGFPTANIIPPAKKALPPKGVYRSLVCIDNKEYKGLTNIGEKPTVSDKHDIGVETYIYDFCGDAYGKMIEVKLLHYVRPERKFENMDELKVQIEKDKEGLY